MRARKTAVAVAVTGTVAGVAGLVVLAGPAGANEPPPALPDISAQALVQSVLTTEVPAMSGAIAVEDNLGLPVPVLPQGLSEGDTARVYSDGQGRGRVALQQGNSETTIVEDGTTLWVWKSEDRSVTKTVHGEHKQAADQLADPATAAKELVAAMQEDSTVLVDGTARIAGRPVYQLVLSPKPTERTLLREVRVSVDSELRVPLRFEVLANGQSDPALKIGFTEFAPGPQDPGLFRYTPPSGVSVTENEPGEHQADRPNREDLFGQLNATVVGKGWDTVLAGRLPADLLSGQSDQADGRTDEVDPMGLLRQFGKEVTGPYGTGWLISTNVGTALITSDGRAALGAVPEQVLVEAIGQVK